MEKSQDLPDETHAYRSAAIAVGLLTTIQTGTALYKNYNLQFEHESAIVKIEHQKCLQEIAVSKSTQLPTSCTPELQKIICDTFAASNTCRNIDHSLKGQNPEQKLTSDVADDVAVDKLRAAELDKLNKQRLAICSDTVIVCD